MRAGSHCHLVLASRQDCSQSALGVVRILKGCALLAFVNLRLMCREPKIEFIMQEKKRVLSERIKKVMRAFHRRTVEAGSLHATKAL